MGRPGLHKNRKFPRLVRDLKPTCKVFAEQVARGALELLWEAAYEKGDDYLGDVADVEDAAHWKGPAGALCKALLSAGGEGEVGFIEEVPHRVGHYIIHDLYDHAPDYVKKRMEREAERITKGQTISGIRREAALKRHQQTDANENHLQTNGVQTSANGVSPAPAPAPAPAPVEKPLSAAPTVVAEVLPLPVKQHSDAERVFEEWRRLTQKTAAALFTKERQKRVKERLAEGYTVDRLVKAIRGCLASPHHQGKNESGTVYDDLELICRTGTHVEKFESFVDNPPKPQAARPAGPGMPIGSKKVPSPADFEAGEREHEERLKREAGP